MTPETHSKESLQTIARHILKNDLRACMDLAETIDYVVTELNHETPQQSFVQAIYQQLCSVEPEVETMRRLAEELVTRLDSVSNDEKNDDAETASGNNPHGNPDVDAYGSAIPTYTFEGVPGVYRRLDKLENPVSGSKAAKHAVCDAGNGWTIQKDDEPDMERINSFEDRLETLETREHSCVVELNHLNEALSKVETRSDNQDDDLERRLRRLENRVIHFHGEPNPLKEVTIAPLPWESEKHKL